MCAGGGGVRVMCCELSEEMLTRMAVRVAGVDLARSTRDNIFY